MTYGFLTIATGDEQYYRMADNLLRSSRYFTDEPIPFAILCDQKNAYTDAFDDVRLFPAARRNYLDKLEMVSLLPYDVNIFIDADCLAYGDLNGLFDRFAQADDFSCFGRVLPLDDRTGWFEYENLGELRERVSYVVGLHGGIYYIRRTETAKKIFDDAKGFAAEYAKYRFKGNFATPGDEPVVALSMAVNGCRPIPHDEHAILCYWEHENAMRLDLPKGLAETRDGKLRTSLLHWGTRFTRTLLYKKQVDELDCLEKNEGAGALRTIRVRYGFAAAGQKFTSLCCRAKNKLKRTLHRA